MTITVRQTHTVDSDGVKQIIADHYAAMGMRFSPSYVSFRVHESHSGGFSSSPTRLGDTTITLPESIRKPGHPTSMTLRPDDVQAIVAERMSQLLGFAVSPDSVTFNVRDGGGSGFSSRGPSMDGIVVGSKIETNG